MLDNWNDSIKHLLVSEGGFVNHPSDPGGMTNLGVTKKVWDHFIGHESDEAEMRSLTPEMVEPLYKKNYWDACRCDELPTGLDYLVFDFAVNAGPGRAIKTLQSAVGVTPDGGFGPKTLEAVLAHDKAELVEKFSNAKLAFYQSLPTFDTFGKGWTNRVASVKAQAESMLA
jgi:lysozyme family protein